MGKLNKKELLKVLEENQDTLNEILNELHNSTEDFMIGDIVEEKSTEALMVVMGERKISDKKQIFVKPKGNLNDKENQWKDIDQFERIEAIYKIPISYEMYGFAKIQATSMEEAINIFDEIQDELDLPTDAEYIDGSYHRDETIESYADYQ